MPQTDLAFPNFEEALLAARRALRERQFALARAICEHALAAGRETAGANLILARVCLRQREFDRAAAYVEAAAQAAPQAPELFDVAAELHAATGRPDRAADRLDAYRASAPPSLDLVRRQARYDMLADRPQRAIDLLTAALAHFPGEATLYDLLAEICLRARRWGEAARWSRASLRLDPANPRRQLCLLDAAARLVDFESIRTHCAAFVAALTKPEDTPVKRALIAAADLRPMHAALYFESDALTRLAADRAVEALGVEMPALGASPILPLTRKGRGDKIRIGYLSGDFRDHPVMQLMRGFFALHDTERFDVRLFSYGPDDGSRYRRELRERHPDFVDLDKLDDTEAARTIERCALDVLVDLKGWNRGTRMGILARRPAPVQVGYLGFPGTYGGRLVDHMVVDGIVAPPTAAQHYAENLLRLPACYLPTDNTDAIPPAPPARAAFGLPEGAFVLGSFNRSLKLSEENLRAWMAILDGAPHAVLWLSVESPAERDNLRAFARASGVAAERLVFATRLDDKGTHLARLGIVDLALDTWRYNGHTSTIDMLWAGVPVLAKTGSHFASRVSESILKAAGLPELVASSAEDYVATACALANRTCDVAPVRAAVAQCRKSSPLFDTAGFTRDFLTLIRSVLR